jgi:hypothetical protein
MVARQRRSALRSQWAEALVAAGLKRLSADYKREFKRLQRVRSLLPVGRTRHRLVLSWRIGWVWQVNTSEPCHPPATRYREACAECANGGYRNAVNEELHELLRVLTKVRGKARHDNTTGIWRRTVCSKAASR